MVFLGVPDTAQAQVQTSQAEYERQVSDLIESLLAQILVLQAQLDAQLAAEAVANQPAVKRPREIFNGSPVLKRYFISGEKDVKEITNLSHRLYLQKIYDIFPDTYDKKLSEFVVFRDKRGDFDAFVETVPPSHTTWTFAVNSDVLSQVNKDSNRELITHELAHIISYEEIPNTALAGRASCHEYFSRNGCPKSNSYIASFVETFWGDEALDRAIEFKTYKNPIDEAYDYYEDFEDEYVSGYAALSPEEDFAESFAEYVVDRGVEKNEIESQKVWWFEQFADLQDMRRTIRSSF